MIAKLRRVLTNPRELTDRLGQEARNLWLYAAPPSPRIGPRPPAPALPDPDSLRRRHAGTPLAAAISGIAAEVRAHRFPLLGITLATGPRIHWRRDYLTGRETGLAYLRRIPYLDVERAGDHKLIWELNRHQHLVLLAQDALLNGNSESLAECAAQLTSWLDENPFHSGMNWTSALEGAFRALSWCWVWHLVGPSLPTPLRQSFWTALYRHGLHLETNLSHYFAPNTHLLGEAVALHALGLLFPEWPESERWRRTGHRVVDAQLHRQVQADGSHFEHSSYYHVYALDMFLFHAHLAGIPDEWRPVLSRMAIYLDTLLGPTRRLPFLGDDDGGRFFHPYGEHDAHGRATLATAALLTGIHDRWGWSSQDWPEQAGWWLSALPAAGGYPFLPGDRVFAASGLVARSTARAQILFDAGTFGWGQAGHSHSDALSLVVNADGQEVLIDPGTYTYVGDPARRQFYRGSAAHNTVRLNGADQALSAGPFAWAGRPEVTLVHHSAEKWEAHCRYNGFTHTRIIHFSAPGRITVEDSVSGPDGEQEIELYWHLGPNGEARLTLPAGTEAVDGWRSTALGRQEPAPVRRLRYRGRLPWRETWGIQLDP